MHDVWSAGIILYEMFYGKKPFPFTNPIKLSKCYASDYKIEF